MFLNKKVIQQSIKTIIISFIYIYFNIFAISELNKILSIV